MGIERLYADSIEASYERGLRNPAAPVQPDFRTFSFLSAGFGGLTTGFLEQGASFLEGVASFQRYSDERRAEMGARVPDPERKAEVQRWLDAAGRAARVRAQESAPDPQTAHRADQIIHGLTRFGAKAVGSVVAAGPVGGAALLGAEETNTAYRDLTMRGIDSDTALKVAAVQGAISAAGVVLPISGAGMAATTAGKVAATAGLVAVGGPGAYVAQEALARDILQRAGYADEAAKHDPADLLGLGISTVLPGAFGAVALRGALRSTKPMPAVRTEAGVRDAVQLTPKEQAASDAYERSAANLAELRKEIARQKDPAARQVLEAELAKQTEAAAKAGQGAVAEMAARSPDLVDAARVKVLQETVQRSLPESPDAYPRLMEALDALAAGDRVADVAPEIAPRVAPTETAEFRAWFGDSKVVDSEGRPMVVYHGTAADVAGFDPGRLQAEGIHLSTDPSVANTYAASRAMDGGRGANVMPVYVKADRVLDVPMITTDTVRQAAADGFDAVRRGDHIVVMRPEQIKSAIGNTGRFDPTTGSLTDSPYATWAEQITAAIREMQAQARPTDAPTTAQAANPEAAAPARGAGDDTAAAAADAGRPAADVQAAGVARTVADQERQIVEALAAERPDMMVALPGTNESVSLADAMELIRAQQALDESDADLVRAAVLCDLSP